MVTTREIQERCGSLGVQFVPHSKSLKMRLICWVQVKLLRKPFFPVRTWVSQYPAVHHPDAVVVVYDFPRQILHELVHWERQRDMGLWWWNLCYLASKRFRDNEERQAYLVDVESGRHTVASATRELCGRLYRTGADPHEVRAWFASRGHV
jgi:hypothetical protein